MGFAKERRLAAMSQVEKRGSHFGIIRGERRCWDGDKMQTLWIDELRFGMHLLPHASAREVSADFSIVLLRPEIPHNTGAIGRLCVGLGVPLHLVRPLGFALDDRYVARAGLDYWPHLDLEIHDTWEDYLASVKPRRLHFLSTHGEKSLYDCRFEPGDALIFGNESSGLPKDFYGRYRESLFRIPMPGEHARSINLANAVSIAAYECYRQLTQT